MQLHLAGARQRLVQEDVVRTDIAGVPDQPAVDPLHLVPVLGIGAARMPLSFFPLQHRLSEGLLGAREVPAEQGLDGTRRCDHHFDPMRLPACLGLQDLLRLCHRDQQATVGAPGRHVPAELPDGQRLELGGIDPVDALLREVLPAILVGQGLRHRLGADQPEVEHDAGERCTGGRSELQRRADVRLLHAKLAQPLVHADLRGDQALGFAQRRAGVLPREGSLDIVAAAETQSDQQVSERRMRARLRFERLLQGRTGDRRIGHQQLAQQAMRPGAVPRPHRRIGLPGLRDREGFAAAEPPSAQVHLSLRTRSASARSCALTRQRRSPPPAAPGNSPRNRAGPGSADRRP